MKLDIIIPAYNCEKTITRTIKSVLDNDNESVTITVVNDGSTDDTFRIVKKICNSTTNKIKLLSKKNGGPSSARWFGMQKTVGEYIWFIDSGDEIAENCINKIVKILENEQPDVLLFDYIEKTIDRGIVRNQRLVDNDLTKSLLLNTIVPGMCMKIFKRTEKMNEYFKKINDIWFGEDLCFSILFSLDGKKIMYETSPFYIYNRDCESLTACLKHPKASTTIDSIDVIEEKLKKDGVFRKYFDEFGYMCFNRLLINGILLSSNEDVFKDYLSFYKSINVNKHNKYLKKIWWLYYLAYFKMKLPFQEKITEMMIKTSPKYGVFLKKINRFKQSVFK